jgi:hypothetical protein
MELPSGLVETNVPVAAPCVGEDPTGALSSTLQRGQIVASIKLFSEAPQCGHACARNGFIRVFGDMGDLIGLTLAKEPGDGN